MKDSISPRKPVAYRRILMWLLVLCGLILYLSFGYQLPAVGVVIKEQISPAIELYKTRQTLRDPLGYSWQVIVFKEITNGQPSDTTLRLVGYPDAVEFVHPQPLIITTHQGKNLSLSDLFAEKSPAPNVGQYRLSEILPDLPSDFVTFSIPLKKGSVHLRIPPFVVEDWQKIATTQPN
ncbi:DUF3122 domain-containing protein [Ancylothrix sp. C2]|uniref:DUF3122 domain-containing protein n=1 Tax=Ancylothrix sp. D3o TaxID=2953691 RepID=UPI0021BAE7F1|nr:DUF3122 domain-containing protein [Ancylothrix sp. D3o]MCT7952470.1 DUF3122 domain-containing protein [Ancylothrix sp. D3o]